MSYEFSETDGGHDWTPLTFSEILQFRRCSSRLAPNRGGSNCDAEPARRKSHGVDPEAGRRRMPWAYDGQHGHASEHGLLHHRDNAGGTHPRTPPRIARIPCPELRVLASGTESSNPLPSSRESRANLTSSKPGAERRARARFQTPLPRPKEFPYFPADR
jgi:hypothetical protein